MFIRTKKISGKQYAYLVENKWKDGRTVQVPVKYLGRVFSFPVVEKFDFMEFTKLDLESAAPKQILKELVAFELFIRGFSSKDGVWSLDGISVDLDSFNFTCKKRPIALAFYDGFLCKDTIKRIFDFNFSGEEKDKYDFAKLFVEAGLHVNKQAFSVLYFKLSGHDEKI